MKVLITGASGVIGIELAKLCANSRLKILGVDKKDAPIDWPANQSFVKGDLSSMNMAPIEEFGPEVVFHLAASFERTSESSSFYLTNHKDNVKVSSRVLDFAMNSSSVETYIFASSYLVYDATNYLSGSLTHKPVSLHETATLKPRNLVGAAKLLHESEIEFMSGFFPGKKLLSARIFRGFGLGSRDVISRWVRAGLSGKRISVYDAESSFDFIFSKESARKLLMMAGQEVPGGTYNLGSGHSTSISEIVDLLTEILPKTTVDRVDVEAGKPIEKSRADLSRLSGYVEDTESHNLKDQIIRVVEYETARLGLPIV